MEGFDRREFNCIDLRLVIGLVASFAREALGRCGVGAELPMEEAQQAVAGAEAFSQGQPVNRRHLRRVSRLGRLPDRLTRSFRPPDPLEMARNLSQTDWAVRLLASATLNALQHVGESGPDETARDAAYDDAWGVLVHHAWSFGPDAEWMRAAPEVIAAFRRLGGQG